MSNLIPITKIYDIYPKYTFSKDVMRFMDDIVDIPRAEVFSKDEVLALILDIRNQITDRAWNIDMYDDDLDFECCYLSDVDNVIQKKIDVLTAEWRKNG